MYGSRVKRLLAVKLRFDEWLSTRRKGRSSKGVRHSMAKKWNSWFGKILSLPVLLSALGMNMGCAAAVPVVTPAAVANPQPCDLLASSTPCVAAMSTTRALYAGYSGPLYQVTRASDKTTADIGLLPDGYANAATQDTFCANTSCTITKIYDQSANHNDLTPAPPGGAARGRGRMGMTCRRWPRQRHGSGAHGPRPTNWAC